ncbi:hypothetical protein OSTOST_01665, partial [Ostertagia ostertagi]
RYCSHTIRLASRWESSTVFHVGDAVVHEWNCDFPVKEGVKYQTFLTSCNAISSSGQLIHLVDENGCIVDSELIGEIVYNSFMPKVFARARVFKFMNEEKYRIECNVQMCSTEGVCKDRIFPPTMRLIHKIGNPQSQASKTKMDIHRGHPFMTGTQSIVAKNQVKWLANDLLYTHNPSIIQIIDNYQDVRFYLSAVINEKMEEPKILPTPRHFLMGISYRSPNNTDFRRNESDDTDFSTVALMGSPPAFLPQNPTISSGEVDNIEFTTTTGLFPAPTDSEANSSDTTLTTDSESIAGSIVYTTDILSVDNYQKNYELQNSFIGTLLLYPIVSANRDSNKAQHNNKKTSRMREKPATLLFYTNKSSIVRLTTTTPKPQNPPPIFASEVSILENRIAQLSLGTDKSADLSAEIDQIVPPINENDINSIAKDKYTNPRDWRLDDRTINDTDIMPERQVACSNATIIASQRKCSWSGIEHLLVVWSFASLLVWIVMIGVCFYRQANKPAWVEFRERELQRMAQSRVLQHEHPWIHADAFEETRCKNKNELTMIQGTF